MGKFILAGVFLFLSIFPAKSQTSLITWKGCGGLCAMDPDKRGASPAPLFLGLGLEGSIAQHDWSLDGEKVAFTVYSGTAPNSDVWSIRTDGTNLKQLVRQRRKCPFGGKYDGGNNGLCVPVFSDGLSWSPDGSEIALLHGNGITYFIQPEEVQIEEPSDFATRFLYSRQAGEIRFSAFQIDWAPDGRIYIGKHNEEWEILSFNRDGSGEELHVRNGIFPAVSPNGERLAFHWAGGRSYLRKDSLFVADIDGRNIRYLTEGSRPSWSPDSQRIVFLEFLGKGRGEGRIGIINEDGTGLDILHEFSIWLDDVDWSPWLNTPTGVSPASWGEVKREFSE